MSASLVSPLRSMPTCGISTEAGKSHQILSLQGWILAVAMWMILTTKLGIELHVSQEAQNGSKST